MSTKRSVESLDGPFPCKQSRCLPPRKWGWDVGKLVMFVDVQDAQDDQLVQYVQSKQCESHEQQREQREQHEQHEQDALWSTECQELQSTQPPQSTQSTQSTQQPQQPQPTHPRPAKCEVKCEMTYGKRKDRLFGEKSGLRTTCCVLGWIGEAKAYLVRDDKDNGLVIVPKRMIKLKSSSTVEPFSNTQCIGFKYQIGDNVGYKIYADNWTHLPKTTAKVLHQILDNGTHWYLLRVAEPHYNASDPDNWWCGFDVRTEELLIVEN